MTPRPKTVPTLAIVLAAGEGTRMRSSLPKVMHAIAGLPMLGHVLSAVRAAGIGSVSVITAPGHTETAAFLHAAAPDATIALQPERRGTAHAALRAREQIEAAKGIVLVMFGDTPLVRPETVRRLCAAVEAGAAVVALGFEAADPTGYGRLLVEGDRLVGIREHKDASEQERQIHLCNGGLMALDARHALAILDAIGCDNAQGEYYLTDCVGIARSMMLETGYILAPEAEILGVNDRLQLAAAEALMQSRLRETAMRAGATLVDPPSVHFCHDTQLAPDVLIEPNVVFGPEVSVGSGTTIRAFSHLEGAEVGKDCVIGPFARLRPGTRIADQAHIGNFVEIKNGTIDEGAKINHLSYIGDAHVGAASNIGAGTITCNYDGFGKYRTEIGAGAFVGSNSSLVAPVSIGEGAYVGSGSVITKDVPADALAVARGRQANMEDWARRFRQRPENLAKASRRSGKS